jgi:pSer/pThr/pTyr-binding forkhead associated (FHA) protein/tetratricopeptide (TPR) repeat protein
MHKLLIEDDEGKTVAVPLIREEITIGRMEGNTIRLTEQNVSRKHARLTLRNSVLTLEDLGSYNGTSLNGSALSGHATLKDGDVILIGDYRLGIQEEKVAQAEPPAPRPADAAVSAPPVVQDALDAQPTIPISTMAVQAALGEQPARLLVVGRLLGGSEFVIDRPSLVVGRTPENDIILNHKSISRHHAKIVREGDRYVILDLESANGVRVGGVEHDRVELSGGDIIELGEVKLRFITGDSALYDEPLAWYQNKSKLAAVLGVSVLGVGALLYLAFSGSPKPKLAVAPPPPKPAVAPVVEPAPPPPPAAEPKPAEPTVPTAELLATAKQTAQAEKWDEALAMIAKAIAQEPGSTDAANLKQAVEAEKGYSEKFAALKTAFADKEWDAVIQGAGEIPDESMYRPKVVEMLKKAHVQYVAAHTEAATSKLAAKDCDAAKQEAGLVLSIDAKNKKALFVVKRCEAMAAQPEPAAKREPAPKPEPVAVVPKPAPRHAAATPVPAAAKAAAPKAAGRPEPAGKAEPAADADKLIKEAQQAWLRGQHAVAIDAARKALRVKPNLTNAYQIIAICSCALHDADAAAKAYEKLDERNKLYVKSSCQKNGISF